MTRQLRIAFFVHEFPALSETFVLNQITGLLDLGHDITIFAVRPRDEAVVHDDVERYGLRERTRYLNMPANVLRRIATGLVSALRHGWERPGITLKSFNIRRYRRDATSLRLLFWASCLRNEKPFDIIHCHFGPIGQLAAKLRDVGTIAGRLVTVFHGVDVSAFVRDQPNYYRFLFATGDLFQPISQAWSRKLVTLGCDPARIGVHHMGIETARYPFRARRHEPGPPLRVLTVGRMIEKKGIADGVAAVAELSRQGIAVSYAIVGDGPLRSELEELTEKLGISSYVEFLGWQEQADVARLMAENDVLLAPSMTGADGDQEGIPVTIMEAMAAGMLIVSTRHSGIPELVEDGRSGLLVPEHDVPALTAALQQLISSGGSWAAMSAAARDAVQEKFEIATLNKKLVRQYEALLENGQPPRNRPMFIARRRFATN
jgi:colanic acid/amylovoran biosynthesis glycosyltransferase